MPEAFDRASLLWQKIEKLSKDLAGQKAENERLLELIKNQNNIVADAGKTAAPSNVGSSKPLANAGMTGSPKAHPPIAILVIACNRPNAITNHLDQLLKYVRIFTLSPDDFFFGRTDKSFFLSFFLGCGLRRSSFQ